MPKSLSKLNKRPAVCNKVSVDDIHNIADSESGVDPPDSASPRGEILTPYNI